jgi:hypothetical protein
MKPLKIRPGGIAKVYLTNPLPEYAHAGSPPLAD